jgi:hypothetical protein
MPGARARVTRTGKLIGFGKSCGHRTKRAEWWWVRSRNIYFGHILIAVLFAKASSAEAMSQQVKSNSANVQRGRENIAVFI